MSDPGDEMWGKENYPDIVERLRTQAMAYADSSLGSMYDEAAHEIARLRDILVFVSTDPCFKFLGTVTQDRVKGVPLED